MSLNLRTLQFTINGKTFDPDRVDVRPQLGSTEVWRIQNADTALGLSHSFHTHLARFRVLDRDDKPPGPGESGLKDTVSVRPGEPCGSCLISSTIPAASSTTAISSTTSTR